MPASSTTPPAEPRLSTGARIARIALIVAAIGVVIVLGRQAGQYIEPFKLWVEGLGFWGPAVFILGYAAAVVAFVPASALTIGAGAIFGIGAGSAYVFVAATLGAALAFLVSRYVARSRIEARLAGNARFGAIDRAVGRQGRRIVFLLRLSPVFPFNLLNYALGLTGVRFVDYLLASVGMLPGTVAYVYLGKLGGDVAQAAGGAGPQQGPIQLAILGIGLVATFAVAILVARIARRALAEQTEIEATS